jgi:hypothetical protein
MKMPTHRNLPPALWALFVAYFAASLLHFVHNAEFIALYPNMPAWISRETVYLAWLGVTAVGVAGLMLNATGWMSLGLVALAIYGSLGLDGLGHYALALCSEHSLAMNATIWFEVVTGIALASVCLWTLMRSGSAFRWSRVAS